MADKHEQARELVEEALDAALEGDTEKSEQLIEQARSLDPEAVSEVAREVEQERAQADRFLKQTSAAGQGATESDEEAVER